MSTRCDPYGETLSRTQASYAAAGSAFGAHPCGEHGVLLETGAEAYLRLLPTGTRHLGPRRPAAALAQKHLASVVDERFGACFRDLCCMLHIYCSRAVCSAARATCARTYDANAERMPTVFF